MKPESFFFLMSFKAKKNELEAVFSSSKLAETETNDADAVYISSKPAKAENHNSKAASICFQAVKANKNDSLAVLSSPEAAGTRKHYLETAFINSEAGKWKKMTLRLSSLGLKLVRKEK